MQDKQLECVDCHQSFIFNVKDQEYHKSQGYNDPKRCKACRAKKRANNQERRS